MLAYFAYFFLSSPGKARCQLSKHLEDKKEYFVMFIKYICTFYFYLSTLLTFE